MRIHFHLFRLHSSRNVCPVFCWQKLLQRIRKMLEVNEEGVTMYQKDLGSYCKKMWPRTRNILEVTARRCYNVSGTSWKLTSWHLLDEVVTTYQKDVGSYWRRCFHVSKKSWDLMEEDVTTYQEHRDICWKKLLQRIRKILEVSAKRCYNVSERSWKLMQVDV